MFTKILLGPTRLLSFLFFESKIYLLNKKGISKASLKIVEVNTNI